jgi:putative SOS response-associated peptidase YedK
MCGRFSVYGEISEIKIAVAAQVELLFHPWAPQFNISPSAGPGHEQLIAVAGDDGRRVLKLARWWFIPSSWDKPLNKLPTAFNARAENIDQKRLWKGALRNARCLVPATGWREFVGKSRKKQPYHFHLQDRIFGFAGIESTWISPEGETVDSFSIITTEANDVVKPIHDRMPLVVPAGMYDQWLSVSEDPLRLLNDLCNESRQLKVEVYPSDPLANDVRYEGPLAVRKVELAGPNSEEEPAQQSLFGFAYDIEQKPAHRRRSRA